MRTNCAMRKSRMNGEGGRLGNVFARVCVCMCILHFNQDFNQMKEEGHRKHKKCAIKVRFTTKATAKDERKKTTFSAKWPIRPSVREPFRQNARSTLTQRWHARERLWWTMSGCECNVRTQREIERERERELPTFRPPTRVPLQECVALRSIVIGAFV